MSFHYLQRAHRAIACLGFLGLLPALLPLEAAASIEVDGETLEVVDMHLHSGSFGQLAPSGKSFLRSLRADFIWRALSSCSNPSGSGESDL